MITAATDGRNDRQSPLPQPSPLLFAKAIKYLSLMLGSVILVFGVWLGAGCTGQQGPAGPAGEPGLNAGESCRQCHSADQTLAAMKRQWESTAHATGATFTEDGSRTACAVCHNGRAFAAEAAGNSLSQDMLDNVTAINCYSCHNIHSNYDTTDWVLKTEQPVKMLIDTSISIDWEAGNLCVNCHQPRSNPMASASGTTVRITSSHWGPHHSTQAAMLKGIGGYEAAGSVAKANSNHDSSIQNGCVQCHMHGGNHTFEASLSSCNSGTCHPGIASFDLNGAQSQIQALLAEARDTLAAKGILRIDTIKTMTGLLDSAGNPEYNLDITTEGLTGTFSREVAGLYQNYLMVLYDGSKGAHNTRYARYLLTNALEALKD